MKKLKIVAIALIAMIVILSPSVSHAQDSTQIRDTACVLDTALYDTAGKIPAAAGPIIPSDNIAGIPIPAWLQTILIALATLLPAIQVVLKRIPTAYSVKIGGFLGKVLDVLTFFQKDRTPNGGVHQ